MQFAPPPLPSLATTNTSQLKVHFIIILHAFRYQFQTDLHVFKEDPDVPVLLLPLQSGSNGLNIIEATHVLLVEPALNPAHELQAVGRVHRIGQTRCDNLNSI